MNDPIIRALVRIGLTLALAVAALVVSASLLRPVIDRARVALDSEPVAYSARIDRIVAGQQ